MNEFVEVADVALIPPGTGKAFEVGREVIAVFNVDGQFFAIENLCPHEGGPLAEGQLNGSIVTCPLHGWRCNVATGESLEMPGVMVTIYEVKVENDKIFIKA